MQRKDIRTANASVSVKNEPSLTGSLLSFFCIPCIGVSQTFSDCFTGEEKKKSVIAVNDLENTYHPEMKR